jgi:hypothetical protein
MIMMDLYGVDMYVQYFPSIINIFTINLIFNSYLPQSIKHFFHSIKICDISFATSEKTQLTMLQLGPIIVHDIL